MVNHAMVTVIVPVHNSEKYLRECLQSAVIQTFNEIEILCIDGGSRDLSPEIIKEFQEKDSRIELIEDSNTGYGHKLNVGIGRARGKYIMVLESDDRMCPNMIECLYTIAEQHGVDIADSDYYELFHHKGYEYKHKKNKYEIPEMYNCLLTNRGRDEKSIASFGIWTALYRKDFIEEQNISFNESEGASFQDTSFLFMTSMFADSVYHLSLPLYQYRIDNTGSSVKDDKKLFEIVGEFEFLRHNLERRHIWDDGAWKLYYARKYNAFYWNYCRLTPASRELFLEKYLRELDLDIRNMAINRTMFEGIMYNRTFLVVDDTDQFVNWAVATEERTWKEAFCNLLDRVENRKIVVFGTGVVGSRLIDILQQGENQIVGLCDNSEAVQGTLRNGILVCSVAKTVERYRNAIYIIASRYHTDEMKRQLTEEGIEEKEIIIFSR